MDKEAFFWLIRDGKLPPPACAATLGIGFRKVDAEAGTIEHLPVVPLEQLT